MNRYVTEQLLTVEEAERLSGLPTRHREAHARPERASLWAWQSVHGALAQTVSEEQVEQALRAHRLR